MIREKLCLRSVVDRRRPLPTVGASEAEAEVKLTARQAPQRGGRSAVIAHPFGALGEPAFYRAVGVGVADETPCAAPLTEGEPRRSGRARRRVNTCVSTPSGGTLRQPHAGAVSVASVSDVRPLTGVLPLPPDPVRPGS